MPVERPYAIIVTIPDVYEGDTPPEIVTLQVFECEYQALLKYVELHQAKYFETFALYYSNGPELVFSVVPAYTVGKPHLFEVFRSTPVNWRTHDEIIASGLPHPEAQLMIDELIANGGETRPNVHYFMELVGVRTPSDWKLSAG